MTNTIRILGRAVRRRCPRCGSDGLFRGWFAMVDRCPRCELIFESEDGFWLGAMAINLAVAELAFVAVLVSMAVAFWPDPPWTLILVVSLAINVAVPLLFYPFSRTLWLAASLAAGSRR